jgi:hypothetical protein
VKKYLNAAAFINNGLQSLLFRDII